MAIERRMVHFRTDDISEVVSEVDRIEQRDDDKEWVTISPWVDPENLPVTSMLRKIFTSRGPKIPEITWIAASPPEPAQLGVLHATGPAAAVRVDDGGESVPEDWRLVSDHSKRGLLYAIPPGTPAEVVVHTALGLGRALAEVPTDDRWVAEISLGA